MLFFHGKPRGEPRAHGVARSLNWRYILRPVGDELELWINDVLVDTISMDNYKIVHKDEDTPISDIVITNNASFNREET